MVDSSNVETLDRETQSRLNGLWHPIDINWLQNYYSHELQIRKNQDVREHPFLAVLRVGDEEIKGSIAPGHFVVASQSSQKLRLIAEVIEREGGVAQSTMLTDEEAAKQLGHLTAGKWGKHVYPLVVSSEKIRHISREAFRSGVTMISTDSVVVAPDGQILEKPKGLIEVARDLELISGQRIKVLVGVCALVPLETGLVAISLDEGVTITMKIKKLTSDAIGNYLDAGGDSVLSVAGGIDFTSVIGQQLIDRSEPIRVERLKQTIYDTFCRERGIKREPIFIKPDQVSLLSSYFAGVPQEIISLLMNQSKAIQENIKSL